MDSALSSSFGNKLDKLKQIISDTGPVVVAVSGGVDSMTLNYLAHTILGKRCMSVHAVSPAVPKSAAARVADYAEKYGWNTRFESVGEMEDQDYLENPVNRCYFCKKNLYGFLGSISEGTIFSGTNVDDMTDFRPGLMAASENGVRHPYVEAEMSKADVRQVARLYGLSDLSELPSSPCLSSRVETGIAINKATLKKIDEVEDRIKGRFGLSVVRCRVVASGIVIELGEQDFDSVSPMDQNDIRELVDPVFSGLDISVRPYVQGSAFKIGE